MRVRLINNLNMLKEVKVGFSWTILFFGFFVPLFRQDWIWGVSMFFVSVALMVLKVYYLNPIFYLIMAIIYNKLYIENLLSEGWRPASENDERILVMKGISLIQ
ncbi:hypothetical protein HMPREF9402_0025 [Turicibacter sp. HGF1]|uniref:hypothetical protein n=1 Tax=Turicibacter sp. HGF1 TaxID=910310 RepID=UPI0001FD9A0A|nr:hypothetical protein [Turicibacter sp. HGF1]EGC92637.1 hypothetical protein HMPREF9402_0025 [Turicibacter sp. HGF1]